MGFRARNSGDARSPAVGSTTTSSWGASSSRSIQAVVAARLMGLK